MKNLDRQQINFWMIQAAQGDRSVFDPLFEAICPLVTGFARKLLHNESDADDVAQQVMLSLFQRASEFRNDADAITWVLGITAFECKTLRKKIVRRRENDVDTKLLSRIKDDSDLENKILTQEIEASALAILGELKQMDQETILAAINNEKIPGISPTTFRKRLERGLNRFRTAWSAKYEV